MDTERRKVCVIGAGPAGLAALRHLQTRPDLFDLTAFEAQPGVGGTWRYSEQTDTHSSMYKNLVTNLPKEIIKYGDYDFPEDLPSFLTHHAVLSYLEGYAREFDLHKNIKFNHKVTNVSPIHYGKTEKWQVDLSKDTLTETHIFDLVLVCNGHSFKPRRPTIPGLDRFDGKVIHSHNYRRPEDFRGQHVLVVGGNFSGTDIANDTAPFAQKVTFCHHYEHLLTSDFPSNVEQIVDDVKEVSSKEVFFQSSKPVTVDSIVLCTGYSYDFPFLSEECNIEINDGYVYPLYKHIFHAKQPSLMFVGIPERCVFFPLFETQSLYIMSCLTGKNQLPNLEDMLLEEAKDHARKMKVFDNEQRTSHWMGPPFEMLWAYEKDLADLAGVKPHSEAFKKVVYNVFDCRKRELHLYRKHNYKMIDENTFEMD